MKELINSAVIREFGLERESEKVRFLKSRVVNRMFEVVFEYGDSKIIAFFEKRGIRYALLKWWFLR